jgi:hypothetical protein
MFAYSISSIIGLGCLVCWIIVLIQMFKSGVLTGILGLICGLYAFIWGWLHAGGGLRNVMLIWTILLIAAIISGFVVGFPGITGPKVY